mgnify:CR=1 FL=1
MREAFSITWAAYASGNPGVFGGHEDKIRGFVPVQFIGRRREQVSPNDPLDVWLKLVRPRAVAGVLQFHWNKCLGKS